VTASYTVQLSDRCGLYANAFRDLSERNFGILVGFTFMPFKRVSASAGFSLDRTGRSAGTFQATRPAVEPGDWGASVSDQEGSAANRSAHADYLGTWGSASAGVAQFGNEGAAEAELRGAIVLMDGALMFSNTVGDSFAVVRTGDVPGVPVTIENRPVGTTDTSGRLLVPYLSGYQPNTLAVDANHVSLDVQLDSVSQEVRPGRHAGLRVDFGAHRTSGALVQLEVAPGKPVPLGASARLQDSEPVPVGYDGEAYITGLAAQNRLDVSLPDGTHCMAEFAFQPMPGNLPTIGPVPCQASH
jgi:outer membrane usher protein